MRIPPEPPFRSVAEQQLQRAVNAPSSRTAKVRVLPLRPFLHPTRRKRRTDMVRQKAGRTSLWMLHFADVAKLADAAARGAVGRKPTRGTTPLVRTKFLAAWLE